MKHTHWTTILIFVQVIALLERFVLVEGSPRCRSHPPCFDRNVQFSITKEKGQFAELECRIIGLTDKDAVIWEKNSQTISVKTTFFRKDSRYTLLHPKPNSTMSVWTFVINYLETKDAGVYGCKVNSIKTPMYYELAVTDPVPIIQYSEDARVKITAPAYVLEGSPFNITCSINTSKDSTRYMSVDWFRWNEQLSTSQRNGVTMMKQISGDSQHYITSDVILSFKRATPEMEGDYECRAYTPVNSGTEALLDSAMYSLKVRQSRDSLRLHTSLNGRWTTPAWHSEKISPNRSGKNQRKKDITQNDDTYNNRGAGLPQRQDPNDNSSCISSSVFGVLLTTLLVFILNAT